MQIRGKLALLLIGGFRSLIDDALAQLSASGYGEVRPIHILAPRAITTDATNASELGRRLSVTKQAAAKTILGLQEMGYLTRDQDQHDSRLKRLQVSSGNDGPDQGRESLRGPQGRLGKASGDRTACRQGRSPVPPHWCPVGPPRVDTLGWMSRTEVRPSPCATLKPLGWPAVQWFRQLW
jgi:hypothetical protein